MSSVKRRAGAIGLALGVERAVVAALLGVFSVVTEDVLDGGELVRLDDPVSRFLIGHRAAELTSVLRLVTQCGRALVVIPLVLAVGLLARLRSGSTGALVKALGYAFPSGHSTAAAAWLSAAIVLGTLTDSPVRRTLGIGLAVVVVALVGISRIYLGVHAPTDVLGGWLLGAPWVIGALAAGRHRWDLRPQGSPSRQVEVGA